MKQLIAAAFALVVLAGTASAAALPDYDAFLENPKSLATPGPLSGQTAELVRLGQIAHVEPRLGVPTFFWAAQDAYAPSPKDAGLTAQEAARRYLFDYAALYRAAPAVFADARLDKLHNTGRGAIIADFEKVVRGIPVFRDRLHVVMNQKLQLVALTGYLNPTSRISPESAWNLSRATALSVALADLTGFAAPTDAFFETGNEVAGYHYLRQRHSLGEDAPQLTEDARVKDVWFGMPKELVPAYYVEVVGGFPGGEAAYFSYVVSAVDGRVLFRRNLTDDSYTYRVWADPATKFPQDGPQGDVGSPHPTGMPGGYSAPFIAPSLVSLANGPISTNDPWLPTGALYTIGNNVEAYADLTSPDGFTSGTTDQHATVNGTQTFDYAVDPTMAPGANATQIQGAVTQLFYTNNFSHDWYYDNGFDEASGNAQTDNYGRGGVEGDSLKVEAQDYGGTNNANMSTPSDGRRPRMQMYLWGAAKVTVNSPAAIAGTFAAGTAGWGPTSFDVTGDVSYVADSSGLYTGCTAYAANALSGKIALIDRGACTFTSKVENAQAAGAIAVLIANINGGGSFGLGGTPSQPITIGAMGISESHGAAMKPYIADGTGVSVRMHRSMRDGTIDNSIVAHEWGHYISNRLVGNSSGLSTVQARGMGEGWADFHALLLVVRETDGAIASNANFAGTYSTAPFVADGRSSDGIYYGIRRAPYSVDFTKNGLTFAHIENGVALPTTFPLAYGQAGTNNAEVHNTGEVWCSMLWQGFVGLVRANTRLTFVQAQERMKDYLVAGYKATPNAPTFTEARDAILAAAWANDPQDYLVLAQAFATRGAGLGAVSPDRTSTTNANVVESFLTGKDATLATAGLNDGSLYCDNDGFLDNGETGQLLLTFKNTGHENITQLTATVTSATPGVTIGSGGVVTFGAVAPFGTVSAPIDVTLQNATGPTVVELDVEYSDPGFVIAPKKTAKVSFLTNYDEALAQSATDNVEAPTATWVKGHDSALSGTQLFERKELSPTDHVWYGPNPGAPADIYLVSPPLQVAQSGAFSFTFKHHFDFETGTRNNATVYFDGAVIELSDDNGQTWTDIGAAATAGGYNITEFYPGTSTSPSTNPLKGRPGFGGQSAGYPADITTTVDLGTTYAGKSVQVRFRIGADDNSVGAGWEIDDIAFTNIVNTPFNVVANDDALCVNRPPVAAVGPDQVVDERDQVTLDGTPSSDPDGDALTYAWSQLSGPPVTLQSGTFTAPEVTQDSDLTFQLVVSDGQLSSAPATAKVTVRQKNRAPTVSIGVPERVAERSEFILTATVYDPEGDEVSYTWTQEAGPPLVHEGSGATLRVQAGEVSEDTAVSFRVDVSDGAQTGSAVVEVTVLNVNRPPVADAGEDATAKPGEKVALGGNSHDPDGDALSFTWRQVEGEKVDLGGADGKDLSFTAPEVTGEAVLTFELTASDGTAASTDRVNVTVNGPAAGGCGCNSGTSGAAGFAALALLALGARFGRRRGALV